MYIDISTSVKTTIVLKMCQFIIQAFVCRQTTDDCSTYRPLPIEYPRGCGVCSDHRM